LGTLLLSAGTPMISAGDELGRTQQGNNNAYCQDNEISWLNWDLAEWQRNLLSTTRYLLLLRREHAALRPDTFFRGARPQAGGRPDLAWFDSTGSVLGHDRWHDPAVRTLQMLRSVPSGTAEGATSDVLIVINGALDLVEVTLADEHPTQWELAWDSTWDEPGERAAAAIGGGLHAASGETVDLEALSLRVYVTR
jgi:isoamylase